MTKDIKTLDGVEGVNNFYADVSIEFKYGIYYYKSDIDENKSPEYNELIPVNKDTMPYPRTKEDVERSWETKIKGKDWKNWWAIDNYNSELTAHFFVDVYKFFSGNTSYKYEKTFQNDNRIVTICYRFTGAYISNLEAHWWSHWYGNTFCAQKWKVGNREYPTPPPPTALDYMVSKM